MANEDGTCWIVFNGEVYNHRTLRPLLEAKGHRFRTVSDTEAILHAYEEFGPACVERLEGMFAFAIYDGRRRELFAARDRLGKKPFFYTVLDGVLHFASELPALARSPALARRRRPDRARGLPLARLLPRAGDDLSRRPQAAARPLAARRRRPRSRRGRYWDVTGVRHRPSPRRTSCSRTIDATLRAAVHDRLESEVPLGAFLSGGIDSGLVVSYMAEALGDRLVTTTVGFGDAAHNELEAAGVVGDALPQPRTTRESSSRELDEVIEPVDDGTSASRWPTRRRFRPGTSRARRGAHVTVALSGDGGDETFAGYDFRYVPHALEASARGVDARRAWRRPAAWLGTRWPRSPRLPKPLRVGHAARESRPRSGGRLLRRPGVPEAGATRGSLMGLDPDRDPERSPVYDAVTEPYRRCPSTNAVQRARVRRPKVYMPNDPLVKVDRMSMAHGLEVRCPLLDRRVVELAFRIPASRKQQGTQGKALLRALARRRLPGSAVAAAQARVHRADRRLDRRPVCRTLRG